MGLKILFKDINNNNVNEYNIYQLPLKENEIIKKSIEMYNDSEPCIIYKTFIMKMMYIEINDFLNAKLCNHKKIKIDLEEEIIKKYLDLPNEISEIHVLNLSKER